MSIKLKPIDQQVIAITGASSGIGLAIAEAAARRGAKLVLAARSEKTLADIAALISDDGGSVVYIAADVSKRADVSAIAARAVETFEQLDQAPVSITLIQPTAVDTPFPQHARNYMDKEPKLPSPMIDPEKVADAVLEAATHHRRDVKVGTGAVVNTAAAKFAPSLADRQWRPRQAMTENRTEGISS